jgi:hypothetical protein
LAVVQLKTPQLVDHIQATFTWIVQLKEEASHLQPSGDTGISKTNVSKLNDGAAFGYDQVLTYDGYINFHKVRLN